MESLSLGENQVGIFVGATAVTLGCIWEVTDSFLNQSTGYLWVPSKFTYKFSVSTLKQVMASFEISRFSSSVTFLFCLTLYVCMSYGVKHKITK
jgi:hypothetical protein